MFLIGENWKPFIKKQWLLIVLLLFSFILGLIFNHRYEIFVFFSGLLSFMIGKEVEIQLEEKKKRNRFAAKFRVLVLNYLRSTDSLLKITKSHPGQIIEYIKDYINKKDLVFDFLKNQTDKYLFLYDKLKDFSYVLKDDSVNIGNKIWYFDDIIGTDNIIPRNNCFYDEIKKLETTKQRKYIENNENIKTQRDVIEKIINYLGLSIV